jgi:hypothetical protein
MYKLRLAAIATFSVIISACSSVPEISDIEPDIFEAWAACKIVQVKNVKKTNGIPNGERYQLDFSYDVQFKNNLFFDDFNQQRFSTICPVATSLDVQLTFAIARSLKDGARATLKNGDIVVKKGAEYTFTRSLWMVKSEKGWIIAQ